MNTCFDDDDTLVIRLQRAPTEAQLEQINTSFGHLAGSGAIHSVVPMEPELREHDRLDLHRIAIPAAKHAYADLRELIDLCNTFVED